MKKSKLLCTLFNFTLLCSGLSGCGSVSSQNEVESLSYLKMRINPEIELVINEEQEVISVNAINEDGETVLCEIDLVGLNAEEAVSAFTSAAIELGYIDVNTEEANVYILTDGVDEEMVKELEEKVIEEVNCLFDKKGIFGKASPEDLNELKALAEEWDVSLKEAKMINRILELYPEMTLEEILELSFEERIDLIKEDSKKHGLPANLRDEYKEAVNEIKEEYKELFELHKELKELEHKLRNKDLTDEEKATLQAEYDAKKAEFDTLKAEYEAAIELIKTEKREKIKDAKEELKDKAKERRDEFFQKVKEHEEKVKEDDEIKDQIRNWRDGFKK